MYQRNDGVWLSGDDAEAAAQAEHKSTIPAHLVGCECAGTR